MLAPPRKLGICGAVWCSLVRFGVYFDQSVLKNIFLYKEIIITYM